MRRTSTRVIKIRRAVQEKAGIAILRGNLAPRGADGRPAERSHALAHGAHRPRRDRSRTATISLSVLTTRTWTWTNLHPLVVKNWPRGYPGMAEVGNMPLPPKVLRKGITDMVRISDARMSGTAYGTVVLHTAPYAAGGPLAIVQNSMIGPNVPGNGCALISGRLKARLAEMDGPAAALAK